MQWPVLLRPLIKQYGEQLVKDAALQTLGYPALLVHTHTELSKIFSYARRH